LRGPRDKNAFIPVYESWGLEQWMRQVCCISDENCNILYL
jgi:hypothetical protein